MVKDYIIGGLIILAIVVAFAVSIAKTVKKLLSFYRESVGKIN